MPKPWEVEYDEGTPNPLKAFDAPPADEPSWSDVTRQALRSALEQTAQSGQTAATGEPGAPLERTAFQDEPITLKGLIESPVRTAKKAVGMTLEASPVVGGGVAGAALGSEAGPLGTLIGGASGMALGNLVQTMGPNYARALQKYPNDPDKAYEEAVRQTTVGTGGTFASGLLLGVNPFSSRLKNLLAQTFVVQPAAMEATAQVEAGQTGDTERQGFAPAAQAYVQNVVGSVPALGVGEAMHAVTTDAAARQGGAEPQPRVEPTLGTPPGDGAAPPPATPPAPTPASAGEPAKPAAAASVELNTAPGFKPWEMPWDAPPAASGIETGPSAPAESVVPSASQPPAAGTLGPDAVAAAPGEAATAPGAVPASGPSVSSGPSASSPKTAPASRLGQPLRLASWLRRMGGVQDISGELAHMGADRVKGLVNPRGIPLDEAARLAQENGYLPQTFDADGYVDRAHLNDLLEVLYDDLGGRPVYSSLDAERITESQTRARLAEERRRSDFPGDRPRSASAASRDDVPFQLRADPAQLPEQRAPRDGEPAPHEAAQAFLNAARGDYERAITTVRERLASFTGARDKSGKVRAGLEKALADLEDPNRVRVTPQFGHVQGDGFRTFKLERAGRPVGVIIGRVEGSNFHIDAISTDAGGDVHAGGANTFNARVMRQVGRDLRAHLPASVETYSGDRVTGARHGEASRGMTAQDLLTGRLGERRQSNATIDARRLRVDPETPQTADSPLGGLRLTGLTQGDRVRFKKALEAVGEVVRRIAPHIEAMPVRKVEVEQGGRWVQPHGIFTDAGDFGRPLIVFALEGQKYKASERYVREPGDVVKTARHEAIHALYRGGYFKPEEWRTLTRAAIEGGWLEKHDIFKDYRDARTDVKIEEAIAEEFAQGRPSLFKGYPEPVRKIFLKLHALLTQVKSAFLKAMGGDGPTLARVMQALESGEVGRRVPDIRNGPEGRGAEPPFKAAPEIEGSYTLDSRLFLG